MILLNDLKRNSFVEHPKGGLSFGRIPDLPQYQIRAGEIYLRKGDHLFGAIHIWNLHEYDLRGQGYLIAEDVADYVAIVLSSGSGIYQSDGTRLTVIRSSFGIVILEPRDERHKGFFYSVVTAYPKRQAKGTLVGQL